MKWVKLTKPTGEPVFVNLTVMATVERSEGADETLISAPMVALAGECGAVGRDWFVVAVKEAPEEIISRS